MPEPEPGQPAFIAELCRVRPRVDTFTELLDLLAFDAEQAGYVHSSFSTALSKREAEYPTGLPTATPVAIPHVGAEHVRLPGLVAATLDPPVTFREMGSKDRTVDVGLVVLLLVTDPAAQVTTLGKLITLFQRPDLGGELDQIATPDELAQILNSRWRLS